ncbi:MAG: DNA repair protein RadA [Flavobacteriales bacterium]|nr:DNA repair protein RadA [Flavobacteriales bacterium]
MAKVKTQFFCQNCGQSSPKWVGKCPSCNEWNTYVEEVVSAKSTASEKPKLGASGKQFEIRSISEIEANPETRFPTPDKEFDRVLGGGLVPGSLTLIGGEPGIGKSTLLLQLALNWPKKKILYISGEESEGQIKMRAERIGIRNSECYILTETSTLKLFKQIKKLEPEVIIVDSIQTIYSELIDSTPGSVSQIRECTGEFLRFAKENDTPVILVGHITKDGSIAGPKILEHMVDTVLQFEGDRHHLYRIVRAVKNRFGSTPELGIYEMKSAGLEAVSDPSRILVPDREEALSGVAISATLEGIRPMLIETQALVSSAVYGTPQRSATGFDIRRLNMLLAVLEKRCGFNLGSKDVFLNITGGLKVDDPALDLGVICAILSSNADLPIQPDNCFAAEVGLSGEIRPVNRIEQRIEEAAKMGMKRIFISKRNADANVMKNKQIQVIAVAKVNDVFAQLFG